VLWSEHLPARNASGNKYRGATPCLYGGYPTTGAARMAARAAARAGAGLTTIAVPEIALAVYAAALLSIMVRPLGQPRDLVDLLADARYNALLIDPVPAWARRLARRPSPCCGPAARPCSTPMP